MTNLATLYTKAQVAKIIGVTSGSVTLRIQRGGMKVVAVNGATLVPKSEIAKWQKERKARAAALHPPTEAP